MIRKHVSGYNDFDFANMIRKVFYVNDLLVSVADASKGVHF